MQLIRRKELSELTGISRAHLYLLIGEGKFPRQIHIGKRASAWIVEEVQAWVDGVWHEGMTTSPNLENSMKLVDRKTLLCSGQLKLATVLEFSQYSRSDSLGVRPPLY
ncbi:helix-turn-helix transcriptional regulator [Vibrio fluvialis]|uniref:helix-turn-helix transcriptional regulator n=1 Tax=Vibrio fluvialis TaxID=676 RepID=UPI001F3D5CD9|nr:AlpA family phage regulatory protein [Vibrio fluvialis]MCE7626110.1 AlpA family phage regulatory protein [Vibrio fluvialis]